MKNESEYNDEASQPIFFSQFLILPLILVIALFVALSLYWIYSSKHAIVNNNSKIVIINNHGKTITVPTVQSNIPSLLSSLNISLAKGDVIEPNINTPINQDNFRINIYRARPVEIVDGNNKTFSYSAALTPRAIASQVGVTAYPEDYLTVLPSINFIKDNSIGERIVINRATPVNLNIYGTPTLIRTHATTVGQLASQNKIILAKGDSLSPSVNTPITQNLGVFLTHHGTNIINTTENIPMATQTVEDNSLAYGTSSIRQQGSDGIKTVTYTINLINGKEVSRSVIQSITTKQPVTQIVVQGTSLSGIKGDMGLAGIAASDYQYADYIISHESGWCPTKAQGEHFCPVVPDNAYTSAGFGLCQATPGYKMASAGSDWATNPITQLHWCSGYAKSRYGGWYAAYQHWLVYYNW